MMPELDHASAALAAALAAVVAAGVDLAAANAAKRRGTGTTTED